MSVAAKETDPEPATIPPKKTSTETAPVADAASEVAPAPEAPQKKPDAPKTNGAFAILLLPHEWLMMPFESPDNYLQILQKPLLQPSTRQSVKSP